MAPERIHVRYTKFDGSLHWHYDAVDLGEDEHGHWISLRPGDAYRRGEEPARHAAHGFIGVIPRSEWWSAEFNPVPMGDSMMYVNVNTPATWDGTTVEMVDLDLDVVRRPDRSVAVLDEDEFAEHSKAMGYPRRVLDRARSTAAAMSLSLERGREPFGTAGPVWLASALGWAHGTVVDGHGVASGLRGDPRFPGGTLALQAPLFAARGLDLSSLHPGTINVDLAPLRLDPRDPRHTFEAVAWHPDVPPETFSFFDARIATADVVHEGLVYRPHPETKPGHPQPATVVEMVAPPIEGLQQGQPVSMWVDPRQGRFVS